MSDSFLTTSTIWAVAGMLACTFLVAQGAASDPSGLEAVRGVYIDGLTGATIFLIPTSVSLHARIRRAERGLPDRFLHGVVQHPSVVQQPPYPTA